MHNRVLLRFRVCFTGKFANACHKHDRLLPMCADLPRRGAVQMLFSMLKRSLIMIGLIASAFQRVGIQAWAWHAREDGGEKNRVHRVCDESHRQSHVRSGMCFALYVCAVRVCVCAHVTSGKYISMNRVHPITTFCTTFKTTHILCKKTWPWMERFALYAWKSLYILDIACKCVASGTVAPTSHFHIA